MSDGVPFVPAPDGNVEEPELRNQGSNIDLMLRFLVCFLLLANWFILKDQARYEQFTPRSTNDVAFLQREFEWIDEFKAQNVSYRDLSVDIAKLKKYNRIHEECICWFWERYPIVDDQEALAQQLEIERNDLIQYIKYWAMQRSFLNRRYHNTDCFTFQLRGQPPQPEKWYRHLITNLMTRWIWYTISIRYNLALML